MIPFRSLFSSKKSLRAARTAASKRQARPWLECLEDRTLLNSRFVVPLGAPVDNVANFASLQGALTTVGLSSGDSITIMAGSSPGQVATADLQNTTALLPNITIQGDPTLSSSFVPQFQVTDQSIFAPDQSGFTLKNVNVGFVGTGQLIFSTNATVTGSTVVNLNVSPDTTAGVLILGAPADVLTNSTLVDNSNTGSNFVVVYVFAGGSNNLISGNIFVENGNTSAAIRYFSGTGAVTDRVVGNAITSNTTIGSGNFLKSGIAVNAAISGLTIQGNTITDNGPGMNSTTGVEMTGLAQGILIQGNVIQLGGAGAIGVLVRGGIEDGTTTSATLTNNQISTSLGTPGGTGLMIDQTGGMAMDVTSVTGQGNDFHNNQFGVRVVTTANTAPANLMVDLGGGGTSQGGNNFRNTPPSGSATGGAIVVSGVNPGTATVIQVQNDIFGTGVAAVFNGGSANVSVNTGGNLTGNAAFVQTAYERVLGRLGNTSSASDAGSFVNGLNGGTATQAQVAASVVRSSEALGVVVDGLYQRLLGRSSDAAGRAGFVNFLKGGGTVEQAIVAMVSSAEYKGLFGSDTAYVQSLYRKLLGREGSQAEVQGFLEAIATAGRAGVANAFVNSAEFRGDVVNQLYSGQRATTGLMALSVFALFPDLLHRTGMVSVAQVQGYVNSGKDILSIEVIFVGSPEFFQNG